MWGSWFLAGSPHQGIALPGLSPAWEPGGWTDGGSDILGRGGAAKARPPQLWQQHALHREEQDSPVLGRLC